MMEGVDSGAAGDEGLLEGDAHLLREAAERRERAWWRFGRGVGFGQVRLRVRVGLES